MKIGMEMNTWTSIISFGDRITNQLYDFHMKNWVWCTEIEPWTSGSQPDVFPLHHIQHLKRFKDKDHIIKNPNFTFMRFGLTITWKWNYKSVSNLTLMKEAKHTMMLKPNCIIHIHNCIYKFLLVLLILLFLMLVLITSISIYKKQ